MQRREFRAMGSDILVAMDTDGPLEILEEVPIWFENWEQVLSRFRADSELSRLNSSAGTRRPVSDTLWQVYSAAREAAVLTDGLVNPLILNALKGAGYDRSFDQLGSQSLSSSLDSTSSDFRLTPKVSIPPFDAVVADSTIRALSLPAGVGLDLGGVAKGWAAHTATQKLGQRIPALVSAGGDIAISGARSDGEPWPIGVEDPLGGTDYLEIIYLEHGGVATSGKDRRRWRVGEDLRHHVIDPRSGLPANTDVLTATVIAPTVMKAEAMAKAAMILGSEEGLRCLNDAEGLAGMMVLDSGQKVYSRAFAQYL